MSVGSSVGAQTGMVSLFGLDPATYVPHRVHREERSYSETNCYADILIELVHAAGHEPLAVVGSALTVDFESDQWTFFKPQPDELELLYGIDIHEMQPYRPLPEQVAEQIEAGRTLIAELDSFYLPDVAGTSYRTEHVKSSAVMEAIDRDAERLRYFHNGSLFELGGDDYRNVFRLGREFSPDVLPPYTELVRFDRGQALDGDDLRDASLGLLRRHVGRMPDSNPFIRFGASLEEALPALLAGDAADYHAYAFATVRMAGAAFELGASHVEWLLADAAVDAAGELTTIVEGCKVLSFRLARRKPFDPAPLVGDLAASWERARSVLGELAAA